MAASRFPAGDRGTEQLELRTRLGLGQLEMQCSVVVGQCDGHGVADRGEMHGMVRSLVCSHRD